MLIHDNKKLIVYFVYKFFWILIFENNFSNFGKYLVINGNFHEIVEIKMDSLIDIEEINNENNVKILVLINFSFETI